MIEVSTLVRRRLRSTRLLAGAAALATVLGPSAVTPAIATAATPVDRPPLTVDITPLRTNYVVDDNLAGGVGDVRASWRNAGDPLSRLALTVPAPPGFYFQRSGTLTIYVLRDAGDVWVGRTGPSIESSCEVSDDGTLLQCDSLAVDIPAGASFAVRFPAYIARSAPVTGTRSTEPGPSAILTVGETRVESPIATAVSGIAGFELSTAFPVTGSRSVSGTADPGTTVTVENAAGASLGSALTATDGTWRLTLPAGHGTIRTLFRTVDGSALDGASGYYNSYSFTVSSPVSGRNGPESPTFAGDGQPGSSVSIRDESGRELAHGTVDPSGTWSLPLPVKLEPGAHDLLVANIISDGSTTFVPVLALVVATPESTPPSPGTTSGPATTGNAGTPIAPGTPVGPGRPAGAGMLRLAISVADDGAIADDETARMVRVVVTDGSGPVSGVRVRFRAPDALGLSNPSALTNVRGEAFTTVTATRAGSFEISVSADGVTRTMPVRFAAP